MTYKNQTIMKNMFQFFLFLTACLLSSCAGEWMNIPENDNSSEEDNDNEAVYVPQTEQTDNYTVTYQYQDGVVVLPEQAQTYISKIEADTILYFKEDTPDKYLPEEGDILSARSSEHLPYGLGCKVLSVDGKGEGYKVITTSAALDEIFAELNVKGSMTLVPVGQESRGGLEDDFVSVNLNVKKVFNELDVDAGIGLGIELDSEIDLSKGKFDVVLNTSVDWLYKLGYQMKGSKSGLLWEFDRISFKPVIMGPVVLLPYVAPSLWLNAKGEFEMMLEGKNGYCLSMGMKDNKGICKVTEKNADEWIFDDFNLEGKGSAGLTLKLETMLGLYTSATAISLHTNFELKGNGKLDLDDNNLLLNRTDFDFGLYANMEGFVNLKFLKKNLQLLHVKTGDATIFENTWPLFPRLVSQDGNYGEVNNKITNRFILDGGLICKVKNVYPILSVYEGNKLRQHYVSYDRITDEKRQVFTLTVDKKDTDEKLTLKPGVLYKDKHYNALGKSFSFDVPEAKLEVVGFEWIKKIESGMYWYDKWYIGTHAEFKIYVKLSGAKNVYGFGLKFSGMGEKDEDTCLGIRDGYYSLAGSVDCFDGGGEVTITPYVQIKKGLDEYDVVKFPSIDKRFEFDYYDKDGGVLGSWINLDYFQREDDYEPNKSDNNNPPIKL